MKTAEVITRLNLELGELLNLIRRGTLVVRNHQVTDESIRTAFPMLFAPKKMIKVPDKHVAPKKKSKTRHHITYGSKKRRKTLPDSSWMKIKEMAPTHTISQIADALSLPTTTPVKSALQIMKIKAKGQK